MSVRPEYRDMPKGANNGRTPGMDGRAEGDQFIVPHCSCEKSRKETEPWV